jgi:hypothetical protein
MKKGGVKALAAAQTGWLNGWEQGAGLEIKIHAGRFRGSFAEDDSIWDS